MGFELFMQQSPLKRQGKRFIYPIRKILFLDESGHEPQLRAVHADGATAKSAKMGGEARPSGSGVGLMHRLRGKTPPLGLLLQFQFQSQFRPQSISVSILIHLKYS